jgi:hypothetical protein
MDIVSTEDLRKREDLCLRRDKELPISDLRTFLLSKFIMELLSLPKQFKTIE